MTMNDADALRILGLGPDADDHEVRRTFARQLRELREARAATVDPAQRARHDRALDLTFRASRHLLDTTLEFAVTQELPAVRSRTDRRIVAVSIVGGILILLGLLLPPLETGSAGVATPGPDALPGTEPGTEPGAEPERVTLRIPERRPVDAPSEPEAAPRVVPKRAWFDPLRSALGGRWRTAGGWSLPSRTDPSSLPAGRWPDDWRLLGQRHGGIALIRETAWLLAMPALMDGGLRWGCFSSMGLNGCRRLDADEAFRDALAAGEVGPGQLARLLDRAGPEAAADAANWHRQALDRGNGASGMRLAQQVLGATAPEQLDQRRRARTLHWYQRAATALEAEDASLARSRALEAMALLVAADPAAEPPRAARHLLECRRLRAKLDAPPCMRPGAIGTRLEARALENGENGENGDWGRVRWWYEQAVAEREPAGARGLARILALGRTGEVERRRALALIEDIAGRWESYSQADAAATAAGLSDIWNEGWGVPPDPAQASWWASQAARLGDGRSALRLASAFALGIGTDRDLQRARDLVEIFGRSMPLFEVAFLRSVGRHLREGDGVPADPQQGRAWLRRAFERCRALAEEDPDARLELASMYFAGEGVEADAARAARMYADLLPHAPRIAGNMLAWIRATHPDPALRDGEEALRIARSLVERPVPAGPSPADLHDTLAAALAEAGDPAAAVDAQLRALALLEQEATPGLAGLDVARRRAQQRRRLAAYRAGRPWRDPDFMDDSTRSTG
jgi:TPR repeat protein